MQPSGKWKFLFCVLVIIVQAVLLAKCALFIIRQLSPHVFLKQACPERNDSGDTIGQQYIFTMVVYDSLFIGRWIEAFIIHLHIYKFFFSQSTIEPNDFFQLCKEGLTKTKAIKGLFVVLTFYMLVHSLSIPLLGIALEITHGNKLKLTCESYIYEYHTIYWILDIVRYVHDVAIRLMMVLATMAIGMVWSREDVAGEEDEADAKEPETYVEYLQDRDVTSKDHEIRTKDYAERGSKVERILEIFQTWFIIPWVLHITGSFLETEQILRSWKDGSTGEAHYDFSEITFMVYNFNQLFLLTLTFLCSKRMNTYHYNYFTNSRFQQQTKYQTASRMALASMNRIEKENHFDFVPRIWGTSIKIPVESSLYVVTLLVTAFFTVVEALI